MKIQGAIVNERGVTFLIAVVKPTAMQSDSEAERTRKALLAEVPAFAEFPVILASQDMHGRFTYQGRTDIVEFLAGTDPGRIPWREYTL